MVGLTVDRVEGEDSHWVIREAKSREWVLDFWESSGVCRRATGERSSIDPPTLFRALELASGVDLHTLVAELKRQKLSEDLFRRARQNGLIAIWLDKDSNVITLRTKNHGTQLIVTES